MSLRQYLILMGIATGVSFLLFLIVLNFFDPAVGVVPLILFYTSLGLTLIGAISIFGFLIRHFLNPKELVFRDVLTSVRHGALVTIVIIVSLMLSHAEIFSLLSLFLLILSLGLLELYLVSKMNRR